MKKPSGFTIIELIVVIMVIGILAVTAVPRLLGESDYAQLTVRDQLLSELRLTQLRALNDRSHCYAVRIDADSFGIFQADFDGSECDDYVQLSATEFAADVIVILFASSEDETLSIEFDNLGRVSGGNCQAGLICIMNIVANKTADLCFESEGYIHAC